MLRDAGQADAVMKSMLEALCQAAWKGEGEEVLRLIERGAISQLGVTLHEMYQGESFYGGESA